MTLDMWITIAILIGALVLFVTEWLRLDSVALGVVLALMLSGILEPSEALAGFSSTIVLLIASLFVVGGGVFRTGLASSLSDQILRMAGTSETRLMIVIMVSVAVMSAFISNTGTVAVLLPAVLTLAASTRINASKLLIPLAFSSSLGGAMTLIGTPPNLVVSEQLQEAGLEPFSFFSFLPVGAILVVVGCVYMLFVGKRLLPDYPNPTFGQGAGSTNGEDLLESYKLSEHIFKLRVRASSPLVKSPLKETDFSHRYNANVLEILRPNPPQKIASLGDQALVIQRRHSPIHPRGSTVLEVDDVLIMRAEQDAVSDIARRYNLAIQPPSAADQEALISQEMGIAEVVITPESSFIGKSVEEIRFGNTFDLSVLQIRRASTQDELNTAETPLQFGDVLLVQGNYKDIAALQQRGVRDMVLISPEAIQSRVFNWQKAPLAFLVMLGMLVLLITQIVDPVVATMLAAGAMVLTGCLTVDEAYETIDWRSVILIGGMIPLSTALTKVGLVDIIATQTAAFLGGASAVIVIVCLFLLTAVLTQVLSNTATTVLLAPIAIAIARDIGVQPQALMMAVAVAASMAFATPMASPVNTLVMSAGQYHFKDYVKVGVPLILVTLAVTVIVLPLFFPL